MDDAGARGESDLAWRGALLRRYRRRLLRYLVRKTGRWGEAEELAAEVFVAALEAPLPDDERAVIYFLRRRADALARAAVRRRAAERATFGRPCSLQEHVARGKQEGMTLEDQVASPERLDDEVADRSLGRHLRRALAALPAEDRALLLAAADGVRLQALADARGETRYAIARRLRALRRQVLTLVPADVAREVRGMVGWGEAVTVKVPDGDDEEE